MSRVIHEIGTGLSIDDLTHLIPSNGAPGLTTLEDDAPRGSLAQDYGSATGSIYVKILSGSGQNKWVQLPNLNTVNDLLNNKSWREPVIVKEDAALANLAAAIAALNVADQADGIGIALDDRILYTNITGENKNVFIVGGVSGNWTLTEDTNLATEADTLYVNDGTFAGATFNYNGTNWQLTGTESATESAFIRTFVGKSGVGSETPTYSSTNHVSNATSLETAIGALDTEIGADVTTGTAVVAGAVVNTNIQSLDTEAGLANTFMGKAAGADTPAYTSNNFVVDATSLETAIGVIDAELGPNVINGNVILAANTMNANLQALDAALSSSGLPFNVNGITTVTTVDSVLTNVSQAVKWRVYARDVSTPARIVIEEIFAVHDRTSSADATVGGTKDSMDSRLKTSGNISGLNFSVDISGSGGSQTMRLRCVSTASVNVTGVTAAIPVDF